MGLWSYQCYDEGDTACAWRAWYDALPEEAQASHDEIFDRIETQNVWNKPDVDFINKNERIVEIRLTGGVKYRIGGFHPGVRHSFTVLGFWYHKQNVYTPRDIKKTIAKRKKAILADSGKARDCVRPKGTP